MDDFPEKDWKVLRKHKDHLLNSFCETVFDKLEKIKSDKSKSSHERYLILWKMLKKEDRKIGDMFNDWRRSRAIERIASMVANGVLNEEIFSEFSEYTRQIVSNYLGIWEQ